MEKSNSHFEQKPNENYHLQLRQLGALIEETERYLDDARRQLEEKKRYLDGTRRQLGAIENEFNNANATLFIGGKFG